MMSWLIYVVLSFLISLLICLLFDRRYQRYFIFSLIFTILVSFWFTKPGSNDVAPILQIFLMEIFITENNGANRLLRPLGLFFILIGIITSITFYIVKKK